MSSLNQLPVRREIDLLATIEVPTHAHGKTGTSFGNIVELGPKSLILETNRELDPGDELTIKVIFPGQPRGDAPFALFNCVVRKVHDQPNLHFDVSIAQMNLATMRRLLSFLEEAVVDDSPEKR